MLNVPRRSTNNLTQIIKVYKVLGLPSQIIRNQRRLTANGRNHSDSHTLFLKALNQRCEISIAGKQNNMIQARGQLKGINRKLNIHIPLDLAPTLRVCEFSGQLCAKMKAIVR